MRDTWAIQMDALMQRHTSSEPSCLYDLEHMENMLECQWHSKKVCQLSNAGC